MRVTLINENEIKELFKNWGEFSAVCYDTKTKNYEPIGKHCLNAGHFSGSRAFYFNFAIEGCPRFVIDQAVRHEQGVVKNVQSFRYVDKNGFHYAIPKEIKDNPVLVARYRDHMEDTLDLYHAIQAEVQANGGSHERANEQARYVLPMATESGFAFAMTLEALIHYMNMRLCTRTEDVHRELARQIREVVLKAIPTLANDLVPKCVTDMYCKEGKQCCGMRPTKEQFKQRLMVNQDV